MTNQRHAYRGEVRTIIRRAIDACERVSSNDDDLMRAVEIITTLQTYAAMMTLSCGVDKAAFMRASEGVFDLVARCEEEISARVN